MVLTAAFWDSLADAINLQVLDGTYICISVIKRYKIRYKEI
jgi:hypothetical protein